MHLFTINQDLRINRLSTNATKVSDKSITKAPLYPPVISKTLLERVAIKEPTITVNVIIAILFEKYFMPNNVDVHAAVIVGQAPYDMPVRHKPAMHHTSEPTDTAISVTPAAQMVRIFAPIMV